MAKAKARIPEPIIDELKQAARGGKRMPHLSELAEQFILQAGGTEQFVQMLWDVYRGAPPGGIVQVKILDMILRCMRYALDSQVPVGDLGIVSDEDLQRLLEEQMAKVSCAEAEEPGPEQPAASTGAQAAPAPAGAAGGQVAEEAAGQPEPPAVP